MRENGFGARVVEMVDGEHGKRSRENGIEMHRDDRRSGDMAGTEWNVVNLVCPPRDGPMWYRRYITTRTVI